MIHQPPRLKSGNADESERLAKERLEPLPDDIAALVESIRNPKGAISVAAAAKRLRARPPLDGETVRLFQEALAQAESNPRNCGEQKYRRRICHTP